MNASTVLQILKAVDQDLPKVRSFVSELQANPATGTLLVEIFPNAKPIVDNIAEVLPWLDFFQKLADSMVALNPAN